MTVQLNVASPASPADGPFYAAGRDLTGLTRTRCDQCGCLSICSQYFRKQKKQLLCPRCHPTATHRSALWGYLLLLGAAALWAGLIGNGEGGYATFLVINVALCIVLLDLLILPHELLHAAMAWLLRGEVFAIHLGLGPPLWTGRWRGTALSLRRFLIMGLCMFGFTDRRWIRLRYALTTVAPLLGHLLLALWLWPHLRWGEVWSSLAWREMLMIANGFLLVVNLLPFRTGEAVMGTDGMKILLLSSGKITADELHALSFLLRTASRLEARSLDEGLAINEEGLALYPDHPLLRSNWLALAAMAERFEAVLPALLDRIQNPALEPLIHALDLNNMAWSIVRLHQMGRLAGAGYTLAQGLDYATWAHAMIPWQPEIQGTYGALLLETGEPEKAIWYARAAAQAHELVEHRATNLALAAVGYHRLGEPDQAQALLAQAEALDPDGHQIRWARGELGKAAERDEGKRSRQGAET